MGPRFSWGLPLIGVLALVPCLAVLAIIHAYGGRLPLEDQWDTPGRLFEAQLDGWLHWSQFFDQHNEARKAFASGVWMLLAMGGWSPRLEMYTSALLVALCVALYFVICRRSGARSSLAPMQLAIVASVILFNPLGFTGAPAPWLWGVNLENALALTALIGGVCANVSLSFGPRRYAISAACSVAATYSFANGMLLWVLLYPRWFGAGNRGGNSRALRGVTLDVLYLAAFATVVIAYFHGYTKPPQHPALSDALGRPDRIFQFLFAWLGAPLSPLRNNVVSAGATGLVGFVLLGWALVQVARRGLWGRAAPFLMLAAYSLVSGAGVALGRSTMKMQIALASRYSLHVLALYIGLNGLLWLCSTAERETGRRGPAGVVLSLVLALQLGVVASNWSRIYPERVHSLNELYKRGEAAAQFVDIVKGNPDLENFKLHHIIPRLRLLARAGVLDFELVPENVEFQIASEAIDQSASLSFASYGEKILLSGDWRKGPGTKVITHLLIKTRGEGEEKFVSVLPLSAFPLSRGEDRRRIDAWIDTDNFLGGTQVLELFGLELTGWRLVPSNVVLELRPRQVAPTEILDATSVETQLRSGAIILDAVNRVDVLGREEITLPSGGSLEFLGWAYDPRTIELAARVYVKWGERLVPARYSLLRPDVARSLNRPELVACGFHCVIDESLLAADTTNSFSFVIETRQGDYLERPVALTIRRVDR